MAANGNGNGATGAVRVVTVANAKWAVTGVKLELGSVATPYPVEDLARKLARCQRYYQKFSTFLVETSYGLAGNTYFLQCTMPAMRASPTGTIGNYSSVTNASGGNLSNLFTNSFIVSATVGAAGQAYFYADLTLTAEI